MRTPKSHNRNVRQWLNGGSKPKMFHNHIHFIGWHPRAFIRTISRSTSKVCLPSCIEVIEFVCLTALKVKWNSLHLIDIQSDFTFPHSKWKDNPISLLTCLSHSSQSFCKKTVNSFNSHLQEKTQGLGGNEKWNKPSWNPSLLHFLSPYIILYIMVH